MDVVSYLRLRRIFIIYTAAGEGLARPDIKSALQQVIDPVVAMETALSLIDRLLIRLAWPCNN